jgi:anti-anti-sigma regulatory factor
MTAQTIPPQHKPECKLAFHVERGPQWLTVALRGEASFDQAEVISARLRQIPLDGYSLVVLDLAELRFITSRAIHALFEFGLGLRQRGVEVRHAIVQADVWLALEAVGFGELFKPIDLEPRPTASVVA